jgi:hypothetical protein
MSNDPIYLTIRITREGIIDSIETADGISVSESEQSLIDAPLHLGENRIGEFRTITLFKLIAPDGKYTWFVKSPMEFCPTFRCSWMLPDESCWIKPQEEC